jgi:hypothetical protein
MEIDFLLELRRLGGKCVEEIGDKMNRKGWIWEGGKIVWRNEIEF